MTGRGGGKQSRTTLPDYLESEIDMKRSISVVFALFLLFAFSSAAMAQGEKDKFIAKGDGIETCPVTGEPISKSVTAEIFGRTIYFCCSDCQEKVKASPELYIKPTAEEQKKAVKKQAASSEFLGKGDGIATCPVTGSPVNKDYKGEVNGRVFYVCCPGCIDTVKAQPDAYLKKQ